MIAASRINDPAQAEAALAAGDCDLVAMTRAQIADPDLVRKAAEGKRIRHCVGANSGCVDRMVGGLHITCFHNPDVGREERGEPAPAAEPRRVLVVGGGPAGLKTAEIAARRGHAVTLLEREAELGGRLRWVRKLGDAAELFRSVEWLEHELGDLGVDVRTGVEADEAAVAAADVVVLATRLHAGARPARRRRRLDPADLDRRGGRRATASRAASSTSTCAATSRARSDHRARRRERRRGDDRRRRTSARARTSGSRT